MASLRQGPGPWAGWAATRHGRRSPGGSSSPGGRAARPLPVRAGADGRLGERLGLDRPRQSVPPTSGSWGRRTIADPVRRWAGHAGLRNGDPQQLLLRAAGRAAADGPVAFGGATARTLRGRGFFRTGASTSSVTSSVAITVLWTFLFNATEINKILSWVSIDVAQLVRRPARRAPHRLRPVRRGHRALGVGGQ